MLEAQITPDGDVTVEGQHVGQLNGFLFVPDASAEGHEAKTLRSAAEKALASEFESRAERFASTADSTLVLSHDGTIRWTGAPVGRLVPGDKLFAPQIRVLADDSLDTAGREKVQARLEAWLKAHVTRLLGPLMEIETAADLTGLSKGIGYQVVESLGVLERSKVAQEMRSLDQDGRAALRRHGVRFGAYHIFLPALLKPAPRTLAAQLWALRNGGLDQRGLDEIAHLAGSGRTSIKVDKEIAKGLYRAAGFRVCGERAVRVDILERLADLIRPAIAYRPGTTPGAPPDGSADGDGFVATVGMTSLVGCSGEDFASILKSLGYANESRPGPAITVPLLAAAPTEPAKPVVAAEAPEEAAEATAETATEEAPSDEAPAESAPSDDLVAETEVDPLIAQAETPVAPEPETAPAAVEAEAETPAEPEQAESEQAKSVDAEPVAEAAAEGETAVEASDEAPAEEEAAPAEIAQVEVWRLQRHQRPANARPNNRPRGGRRDGAPAGASDQPRRAEGQGQGQGRDERRRDRPEGPRPERRRDEGRPDRRPEHRGEGRHDPRQERHGAPRPDQRPPRRERAPDPDSPFAKLAALKAQLESGGGDKR